MKLSLSAMAFACALLWGGAILFVGIINLFHPAYGVSFLQLLESIYPWYHPLPTLGNVAIGTVDGLVDGAVAGILFGWLYNGCT